MDLRAGSAVLRHRRDGGAASPVPGDVSLRAGISWRPTPRASKCWADCRPYAFLPGRPSIHPVSCSWCLHMGSASTEPLHSAGICCRSSMDATARVGEKSARRHARELLRFSVSYRSGLAALRRDATAATDRERRRPDFGHRGFRCAAGVELLPCYRDTRSRTTAPSSGVLGPAIPRTAGCDRHASEGADPPWRLASSSISST